MIVAVPSEPRPAANETVAAGDAAAARDIQRARPSVADDQITGIVPLRTGARNGDDADGGGLNANDAKAALDLAAGSDVQRAFAGITDRDRASIYPLRTGARDSAQAVAVNDGVDSLNYTAGSHVQAAAVDVR